MKRIFTPVLCLIGGACVQAADFDFAGDFEKDNDVHLYTLTMAVNRSVTFFTSSFAHGSFDPIISVWTQAGNLIEAKDDGGFIENSTPRLASSKGVTYTLGIFDTYTNLFLSVGTYKVAVTQFSNFPNSALFSEGFLKDNEPNFTAPWGGGAYTYFNTALSRDNPGHYALHITDASKVVATYPRSSVPDGGSTVVLAAGALLTLGWLSRRPFGQARSVLT